MKGVSPPRCAFCFCTAVSMYMYLTAHTPPHPDSLANSKRTVRATIERGGGPVGIMVPVDFSPLTNILAACTLTCLGGGLGLGSTSMGAQLPGDWMSWMWKEWMRWIDPWRLTLLILPCQQLSLSGTLLRQT